MGRYVRPQRCNEKFTYACRNPDVGVGSCPTNRRRAGDIGCGRKSGTREDIEFAKHGATQEGQ